MQWQKEVLERNHQLTLVRTARQAGKTYVAIQWARHAGRRVLFAVPDAVQAKMVLEAMHSMYQDEIAVYRTNPGSIIFKDNTVVDIRSTRNQGSLSGLRFDAFVLDEVGFMQFDEIWNVLAISPEARILALAGSVYTDAYDSIAQWENVYHIVVDYLDLIEEGIFKASDVRAMIDLGILYDFEKEMGPWEHPKQKTNKEYRYLLSHA